MPSDPSKPSTSDTGSAVGVHRLEDLLAHLEGHGYKRNGRKEIIEKAADAEVYYGDNDLAVDGRRSKYLAP